MTTILVSAGDLSGERYAAELVRAIRSRREDVRFIGMGGAAMAGAGVELLVDQRELAVGGIFEALTSLFRIFTAWRRMVRAVRSRRPELVILVDSGGFNLAFARRVKRIGAAKVFYYVAPQAWAWRESRVRKLAARCDRIGVILPFEKAFYAERGVAVDFVGHPILGASTGVSSTLEVDEGAARSRLGIAANRRILGLFPGSRRSEIDQHLGIWIETFRILRRNDPGLEAIIALAPSLDRSDFERRLAGLAGELLPTIHVVSGASRDVIDVVDVALAKPGTITLELLMQGVPMVVAGRVHPWTARIIRRSLQTAFVAMPNLLAEREIVPERLQEEARPARIAEAIAPLFSGAERAAQVDALEDARGRLGPPRAVERGAEIVEELLDPSSA